MQPEIDPYEVPIGQRWQVWRTDIYDNEFPISFEFDTKTAATICRDIFRARGHHQTYDIRPADSKNQKSTSKN